MNTRITISTAKGVFVLCDPNGSGGSTRDFVLETTASDSTSDFQIVKYFRGAEVEIIERGNLQTVWSFTLVKEWPDLGKAIAWHEDLSGLCPFVGTVQKIENDYKGGVANRWIANAGIVVKSLPRIGVSTFTQVSILGGSVLSEKPS